jgi:hypothetical protein
VAEVKHLTVAKIHVCETAPGARQKIIKKAKNLISGLEQNKHNLWKNLLKPR